MGEPSVRCGAEADSPWKMLREPCVPSNVRVSQCFGRSGTYRGGDGVSTAGSGPAPRRSAPWLRGGLSICSQGREAVFLAVILHTAGSPPCSLEAEGAQVTRTLAAAPRGARAVHARPLRFRPRPAFPSDSFVRLLRAPASGCGSRETLSYPLCPPQPTHPRERVSSGMRARVAPCPTAAERARSSSVHAFTASQCARIFSGVGSPHSSYVSGRSHPNLCSACVPCAQPCVRLPSSGLLTRSVSGQPPCFFRNWWK